MLKIVCRRRVNRFANSGLIEPRLFGSFRSRQRPATAFVFEFLLAPDTGFEVVLLILVDQALAHGPVSIGVTVIDDVLTGALRLFVRHLDAADIGHLRVPPGEVGLFAGFALLTLLKCLLRVETGFVFADRHATSSGQGFASYRLGTKEDGGNVVKVGIGVIVVPVQGARRVRQIATPICRRFACWCKRTLKT